jgi:hypothetical protein
LAGQADPGETLGRRQAGQGGDHAVGGGQEVLGPHRCATFFASITEQVYHWIPEAVRKIFLNPGRLRTDRG